MTLILLIFSLLFVLPDLYISLVLMRSAAWMYSEWSGMYQEGNQCLYVSEGTGGAIPFRLGATPEIIVFTLHRAK